MPEVLLVLLYAAVLLVPGGILAALAGLRGWTLAAMAPLLTYTVAGLAGPWSQALGIRWSFLTFLGWWAVFAVVVFAVRWFSGKGTPSVQLWPWRAQAGVIACMAAATFISVFVVVKGMGGLSTTPQDWDAVWHANSIRWIADTGEGGLYAPGQLNWYESSAGMFYPNGYHLVAALVYSISGNSVVEVLNSHTIFIPAIVALSMVAVVRRFNGRAVVAGLSALLIVSTAAFYDNLWRGPLLPFETGLALTPLAVILVADLLDTEGSWRVRLRPALVLALGMAGLICVHSSTAFGMVFFVLPMLVMRWVREPKRIAREVGTLVVVGVVVGALAIVELLGMLGSGQGVSDVDWPASETASQAVGDVLMWGHAQQFPQWWLGVALVIGLVTYRRLGDLRWLGAVAAIFGLLFVVAAAYDTSWSLSLTRPWWNDRWRLIALTAIPLCVIAAHGLAEAQRVVAGWAVRLPKLPAARLAAAGVVVLVAALLTSGFYVNRNEQRMSINTKGQAVTAAKLAGYEELGKIVPAGERVLNDRGDGSVWMYAVAGVLPVAGHYDATLTGPEANLLANRFNKYETDPKVREAVRNLHVGYVILGRGFLRPGVTRQPGLRDLDRLDVLEKVYQNSDVVIYKIKTASDA
ncbi:DUF6541 family protein [Actinophytocola oryzae]|uniref:4-amino-4-deoxy-L-arabinose transferase-like glycosyltransferase n=1 Tax=Actinophytocola oryzae TaxID=502181 RepID=A0A4R7VNR6_9PSEU|nr:DUF6541 family protein [Actinophytocola oryzae]TDV50988.1 hypothetical protein CLV71_106334 [Actinophytocola oryzae]